MASSGTFVYEVGLRCVDDAASHVLMVLDGELVAEAGRAQDLHAITPRLRKRRDPSSPGLAFVAFDLV
jgi:hypothetical protein